MNYRENFSISMHKIISIPLFGLLLAGCVPQPPSTSIPEQTNTEPSCGFMSCHGLDLSCGFDAPQMCTMEYRIGDFCRQYATCEVQGDRCELIVDPAFETCKSCVEQCTDTEDAFACEENCREQLPPLSS